MIWSISLASLRSYGSVYHQVGKRNQMKWSFQMTGERKTEERVARQTDLKFLWMYFGAGIILVFYSMCCSSWQNEKNQIFTSSPLASTRRYLFLCISNWFKGDTDKMKIDGYSEGSENGNDGATVNVRVRVRINEISCNNLLPVCLIDWKSNAFECLSRALHTHTHL